MKRVYQEPAIEVLNLDETACANGNNVGGVLFQPNCGGVVIAGVVRSIGAPALCDCPPDGPAS